LPISMLTLGVDTAEPIGGVSLYEAGAIEAERLMDEPLRHAECLIPLTERVLADCSRERANIERVCINTGPGSFTGLRIGLAFGKGLCQALGAKLIGVDGTDVYRSLVPEERRVCVVIRSRRDLFYARWFAGSASREPVRLLVLKELIARLRGETRQLALAGSGASSVYEDVADHALIRLGPDDAMQPSPLSVARIGAADRGGNRLYDAEPSYVESVFA
jgi:tRNA threonylcarbamoyladenosine biosynthesis protein TsaB